ncbi:protein SCO2 homolog, mitochondrial [Crotalus tigris]|uniref:protein SCO2 homolog, mitochondrial n=1 Tax=Crotalus tigris TaxID=88082 RepID=UPI00192F685C|nr:protein SCO2 homolog, mitochondrial [Crotalus tigris]
MLQCWGRLRPWRLGACSAPWGRGQAGSPRLLSRWLSHHTSSSSSGHCPAQRTSPFWMGKDSRPSVPASQLALSTRRPFCPGPRPSPPSERQYPFRTRLLVVSLITRQLGLAWRYFLWEKEKQEKQKRIEELRKVSIGQGSFELVDHTGQPCSKEDLQGSWVLLYFGFTHCPDICPEELEKMSRVVDMLDADPKLPRLQPIFITVDPERDTVEAVAKYVKEFHPRLRGLTGTPEQVQKAGRSYRVYYSTGPKGEDNDYLVDHTVILYLLSPDGLFLDYYNRYKTDVKIAENIRGHMTTYKSLLV